MFPFNLARQETTSLRKLSKHPRLNVIQPTLDSKSRPSRAGLLPASLSRTSSHTLALATATTSSLARHGDARQVNSQTDQYWAARALTAETLLRERASHYNEIRDLAVSAENKRARELFARMYEHDARRAQLERVVIGLFLLLLVFALSLIYLLIRSPPQRAWEKTQWFSSPNHFTIPILSPFTSVVETDSSLIGTRSIMIFVVVTGVVIYGLFRHWMNSRYSR